MRRAWLLVLVLGCGEPIARNVPAPDPAVMAGAAAALAGAATLADPKAAAARQEEKHGADVPNDRGIKVKETVPSGAFDRLEQQKAPPAPAPADAPAQKRTGAPAPVPSPAAAAAAVEPNP